jgi:hypothetical protein
MTVSTTLYARPPVPSFVHQQLLEGFVLASLSMVLLFELSIRAWRGTIWHPTLDPNRSLGGVCQLVHDCVRD